MKLLFVNQFYKPDHAATAQMLADLCERLAAKGHDVHVLTARGRYDGGDGTDARRLPRREQIDGVHVHRVRATGFGKRRLVGRIIDYLTVHLAIGLRLLLAGARYDAIVTLTTPPLVGVYAVPLRWFSRVRHVCWVMDLHPDCEFELGVFRRTSWLARLLDYLNGLHFRKADACVALGERMAQRLKAKGVSRARIHCIDLWGHDTPPAPSTEVDALREAWGLRGRFVVMYSGNAGLIHSFDAVLESARRLRDDERFAFLFVGGGGRLREIEAFKAEHALGHLDIRPYVPREQLGVSLAVGDVHLITMRDGMAGVALPSKLYGILAAGRPALFVGPDDAEPAAMIRTHACGKVFATHDADAFTAALQRLADDRQAVTRMGHAAREAFEARYRADHGCERWRTLLESVVRT